MSIQTIAGASSDRPAVTVGVRFHRFEYLPLLRRALWSLAAQDGVDAYVVICCQDLNEDETREVENVCKTIFAISDTNWRIISVHNPENRDLRAYLLNKIVQFHYTETSNKYLSFLDYDDILFSHAAKTLVNAINTGRYALSYGSIHCANVFYDNGLTFVRSVSDFFEMGKKSKADLFKTNFLPLHSYMFNTSILDMDLLIYDETLERLEDYDVLLRVARNHAVTPFAAKTLIGLYNLYSTRDGGINTTNNFLDPTHHQADPKWEMAMTRIREKHGGQSIQTFVGEDWVEPN